MVGKYLYHFYPYLRVETPLTSPTTWANSEPNGGIKHGAIEPNTRADGGEVVSNQAGVGEAAERSRGADGDWTGGVTSEKSLQWRKPENEAVVPKIPVLINALFRFNFF